MEKVKHGVVSTLKVMSKVGGAVFLQILLFTIVGLVLNLTFLLFLGPEIDSLWPHKVDANGETISFWSNIASFFEAILIIVFFFPLIPIVYFFLGKKRGVMAAISKIVHEKSEGILKFVMSHLLERIDKMPKLKSTLVNRTTGNQANGQLINIIKGIKKIPRVLRKPLAIIFKKVNLAERISKVYKEHPDVPLNSPEMTGYISANVAEGLKEKFPPPKGTFLLIIMLINLVVFLLFKLLI